jgi:hypothetical protein
MLYSYAGVALTTISTEYPGGYPQTEAPQNVAEATDGSLWVYNGTFHPYLSNLSANGQTWTNYAYGQFSQTDGEIAIYGQYVFAVNEFTPNCAVLRFDTVSGSTTTIPGAGSTLLNVGPDGLLYVVYKPTTSPSVDVMVYDPTTLALVRQAPLTGSSHTDYRGLAVAQGGHIITVTSDGYIQDHYPSGSLFAEALLNATYPQVLPAFLLNVSIGTDGSYLAGSRFGDVFIVNPNLASYTHFNVKGDDVFANPALPGSVVVANPLATQTAIVGSYYFVAVPASKFDGQGQQAPVSYSAANLPPRALL